MNATFFATLALKKSLQLHQARESGWLCMAQHKQKDMSIATMLLRMKQGILDGSQLCFHPAAAQYCVPAIDSHPSQSGCTGHLLPCSSIHQR